MIIASVVIVRSFNTSDDAHLFHSANTIAVCSVFNIMLRILLFYQKENVDHESSGFRKLVVKNRFVEK